MSMVLKIIEVFCCGGGCFEEFFLLEIWEGMECMIMFWYKYFFV